MKNEIREYIPAEFWQSVGAEPGRACLPKGKQIRRYPIIRHNKMRNGIELYKWGKILKLNKRLQDLYYRFRTTPKGETEDKMETFRLIKRIRENIESLVKEQERKYEEDLIIKQGVLLEPVSKKPRKNKRNGSYECVKPAGIVESQWDRVIAGRAAFMKAYGELLDQEKA